MATARSDVITTTDQYLSSEADHCPPHDHLARLLERTRGPKNHPEDVAVAEHLGLCERCLIEYQSLVHDDRVVRSLIERNDAPLPFFSVVQGVLEKWNSAFRPVSVPAFRDDSLAVIHSNIFATESACVLIELATSEDGVLLSLERAGKNPTLPLISLYSGDNLITKMQLQNSYRWDLSNLAPGEYRLTVNDAAALHFKIQE